MDYLDIQTDTFREWASRDWARTVPYTRPGWLRPDLVERIKQQQADACSFGDALQAPVWVLFRDILKSLEAE